MQHKESSLHDRRLMAMYMYAIDDDDVVRGKEKRVET